MSGWIKLEKDLMTDPRLMRLAKFLRDSLRMTVDRDAAEGWDGCNGAPLPGDTLILGVLAKLWMIADTHIGEDDILPLGVDEIDDLIGIPGLTEMMPEDWLQVVDSNSVKLPGYHAHNGTVAKEKAQNQKRVARSRDKKKRHTVQVGNATPLPDQDLDRDQDHSGKRAKIDVPHGTFPAYEFIDERMRPKYPKGTYMAAHWQAAERTLERLVTEQGEDPEAILAGVERYAKQQQAEGNIGSKFICNPDRFLTEKRYREEFPISTPEPMLDPRKREAAQREARDWLDLANKAAVCGFRGPAEGESMGAYRTLLERYMHDNRLRAAV